VKKPLGIIREAEAEYRQVLEWYERQRPGLSGKFSVAAREALEMIESFPSSGEPVDRLEGDARIRRMPMRVFPYHVVYLELEESTEVLAFAHDRRQEGYWRSRLKRRRF
jgi:plasmid stabilization system protein ParE